MHICVYRYWERYVESVRSHYVGWWKGASNRSFVAYDKSCKLLWMNGEEKGGVIPVCYRLMV